MKKEKEIRASFAVTSNCQSYAAAVRDKCLVKMKKALHLWVEDRNRKCVLMGGNLLCPKAVSLYKDFSKGSPEKSDAKPFLQQVI